MLHPRTLAVIALIGLTPLLAQRGDRPGEVQAPPPEHIDIPPAPALSADEAMKTFKLVPGFRIELVAADPLVFDPVAMAHGPDGRIWVLEMRGYMPTVEGVGEDQPVGSVAVLEDTDRDGKMDKRTVFLDGLVMPRALALVDGGVLVGEPPHLWYCRDTDGDGVSDQKTEIASDYGATTNPEHTANALYLAMDNWIYNAKHTVRFRYLGDGKFDRDTTFLRGQWGMSQDEWGRLYFNSNSDPLRVEMVPSAYLRRNPTLNQPAGNNVQIAPPKLAVWPGRVTPGINRGYRMLRPDGTLPTVTAACSPLVYRGDLFPAEFSGDVFICEPAGNLVKRIRISERDGMLAGENAYEQTEFLTSTDERFRPVNIYNGPDGAIYIVDMYRGIIQHRTYVTSFLRKQIDDRGLESPIGMGRIYRVVPDNAPAVLPLPNLATASTAELVQSLAEPSGWVRDTAQRLLVEKRDPAAADALRGFFAREGSPSARLQALWTLEGLNALDRATVLRALEDSDGRVRAAGIRFAEKSLTEDPELFDRVIALTKDAANASPAVRLQLALSLSGVSTPAAASALHELIAQSGAQPLIPDAIVSGITGREEEFIEALAKTAVDKSETAKSVIVLATSAVLRSGNPERVDRVLTVMSDATLPEAVREALFAGLRRIIPKTSDGRVLIGNLPAEPKPLIAVAANAEHPAAKAATELLDRLRWPGKPGVASANLVPLTPEQQALFEKGRTNFAICAACHQPNGQGLPGLAPALVNSRWVTGHEQVLARIVLRGKETENVVMPPLRALDDEMIASILTFIRRSWGHEAGPVSVADIAAARTAVAGNEEPLDNDDLEELAKEFPTREPGEGRRGRRNRDGNREREGNRPQNESPAKSVPPVATPTTPPPSTSTSAPASASATAG